MIGMFAAMFSGEKRGNPDLISIFGSNFVRASIFPVRYPCPVRSPMRYPAPVRAVTGQQYFVDRASSGQDFPETALAHWSASVQSAPTVAL